MYTCTCMLIFSLTSDIPNCKLVANWLPDATETSVIVTQYTPGLRQSIIDLQIRPINSP